MYHAFENTRMTTPDGFFRKHERAYSIWRHRHEHIASAVTAIRRLIREQTQRIL